MRILKYLLSLLIVINISLSAQEGKDSSKIVISKWLIAGPIPLKFPVQADTSDKALKEKDLLNFDETEYNNIKPAASEKLTWNKEVSFEWEEMDSPEIELDSDNDGAELTYLITYIRVNRWMKGKIEFKSCQMLKAYLDGKEILFKTSLQQEKDKDECKPEKASKDIELETGSHVLLVKALKSSTFKGDWKLTCTFTIDSSYNKNDFSTDTEYKGFANVERLLEDPKIKDIAISADGELASVNAAYIPFGKDAPETWIDIYKTSDGSIFKSLKGDVNVAALKWGPVGKKMAYTTTNKNETSIWITDFETGTTAQLLKNIKDLTDFYWSPDESYLIYTITEKSPEDKTGIRLIEGMDKRLPNASDKVYLYSVSIPGGIKQRLTAGKKNFTVNSISADGKRILLSVPGINWKQRPYSYSTYYILNYPSMELDSLITLLWAGSAMFSPDGEKILFTGSPMLFDSIGVNVKPGAIVNDYDTQAYIYDIESGEAEAISRDFNPSISTAYWNKLDNNIYFNTVDKTLQHLYKYDVAEKQFTLIKLNADILEKIDFASGKETAVFQGSSATTPDKFYFINLKSGRSKLLYDPSAESFKNVKLGKAETWTFKNARGEEIDGYVHYPPDFDRTKKYPAIIYYYGGTSPVEQAFESRYPFNIWAANGYIIYVLQPSGTVGYGQQFSSYHVNDWGEITAQEIITGTKEFLKQHQFVDSARIGCIGASYGGFMTMNLLTKTNMFTAAVSHAGISNLANYWGVGYWGYSYSAVATANSFPWNRKDIYVEHSAIFNADKIDTPLLLLHGASDTNVPPGESTQMFTALKLLGKDVEYIQVADQDHHIMEYKKRKLWTKTIIAYFDKYLKNQPQWWNSMYLPLKDE